MESYGRCSTIGALDFVRVRDLLAVDCTDYLFNRSEANKDCSEAGLFLDLKGYGLFTQVCLQENLF